MVKWSLCGSSGVLVRKGDDGSDEADEIVLKRVRAFVMLQAFTGAPTLKQELFPSRFRIISHFSRYAICRARCRLLGILWSYLAGARLLQLCK